MRQFRVIMGYLLAAWIALVGLSAPVWAKSATSTPLVSVLTQEGKTRVSFHLAKPVKYRLFTLTQPDRVVVDLPNVSHQPIRLPPEVFRYGIVRNVRSAWHPEGFLRVVMDLQRPAKPSAALTTRQPNKDYVLTISLAPVAAAPIKHPIQPVTKPKPAVPAKNTTAAIKRAEKKAAQALPTPTILAPTTSAPTARKIVIVIDPGHGGKDPGTTGRSGIHEKDVVIAIARDLQADLNKEAGFKAVLTRTGNYYIPLRGRLAIARRDKADMFISIHADAYKNHTETGASVFALSERGATSEAARWLAEKENHSELMGGVDLTKGDDTLRSVLMDLTQTHTINVSLQMGTYILQQLGKITPLHHHQVEQAAFIVLKSPDIPSLLVETGFLSTPSQEKKLRIPRFRKTVARALMLGIKDYFVHHPPTGTELAARAAADHLGG